ncbi:MAG: zinc metalloprotease HtpX [Caldisphaera sp.]|jgi:heat shock protein HtpX|nr:zinc metalloprotease HtpX [Caldisphaera sp.]PMP60267.1 MAG: protease htpX-like protein [Caldisphaera sp.]PMP88672.1 MAG: protease htpX-like protein [Caldisphaera sp.]
MLGGLLAFMFTYWWVMIIGSLIAGLMVAIITAFAPKIVGSEPESLSSLKASMIISAIAIILAGIGVFIGTAEILSYAFGLPLVADSIVVGAVFLTFLIIIFQWLFSPYLINLMYRAHEPKTNEEKKLQQILANVSNRSNIKTPKLRIAEVNIPNAFSYGSPLTGNFVAVTRGILNSMPDNEMEAVLGHEVGHLRHRDVSFILALSLIPLAVYYLGQILIWNGLLSGGYGGRGRDSNISGNVLLLIVGVVLIAAGVLFRFLVAHFNRLREYYADANSAIVTKNPRNLQRALARLEITYDSSRRLKKEAKNNSTAQMLFIIAPFVEIYGGFFFEFDFPSRRNREYEDIDEAVEELKKRPTDPKEEIMATHPPTPKRLRFLDNLAKKLEYLYD